MSCFALFQIHPICIFVIPHSILPKVFPHGQDALPSYANCHEIPHILKQTRDRNKSSRQYSAKVLKGVKIHGGS